MPILDKVSFAVLAGGQSRRFGSDKTLALYKGIPLVSHVAGVGMGISNDVLLVGKDLGKFSFLEGENIRLVKDSTDLQCPLAGIVSALACAEHEKVFVISADSPLLVSRLVEYLFSIGDGFDAVIPVVGDKVHPLCGWYSKGLYDVLSGYLDKGFVKLLDVLEELNTFYVSDDRLIRFDPDLRSFLNINTLEDMEVMMGRFGL